MKERRANIFNHRYLFFFQRYHKNNVPQFLRLTASNHGISEVFCFFHYKASLLLCLPVLLLYSCSVMSYSLWPHGLWHARFPCPSPSPRVFSNSCLSSQWCHPTISSSVISFSSALNLSQYQGLLQWVSSSHQVAKVLELQLQISPSNQYSGLISFRIGRFDLFAVSRIFWTLWEKVRVGCFERTASKHVYYLRWNRSPAQVGCMRQVLGPGALGRPRGIGWRGKCEGGSGWGTHVNPWLIHVNVWQKPLQYCKVISLQLIKINGKKKKKNLLQHHSLKLSVLHHSAFKSLPKYKWWWLTLSLL